MENSTLRSCTMECRGKIWRTTGTAWCQPWQGVQRPSYMVRVRPCSKCTNKFTVGFSEWRKLGFHLLKFRCRSGFKYSGWNEPLHCMRGRYWRRVVWMPIPWTGKSSKIQVYWWPGLWVHSGSTNSSRKRMHILFWRDRKSSDGWFRTVPKVFRPNHQ